MKHQAAVITVSDKCARGERADTGGPAVRAMLEEAGLAVCHSAVVPGEFEAICAELIACADERGLGLVVTLGGTALSPREVTPEATLSVIGRELRGIPEAMRWAGLQVTPRACLSRGVAGVRGRTLIVNLPGSEKAARENLAAVLDALAHALDMLAVGDA